MRITRELLQKTAEDTVRIMRTYKRPAERCERRADPVLFGLLEGRFGGIQRQYNVPIGPSANAKRIDFRQRGARPVLIEFAVATNSQQVLKAGSNRDELIKLERMPSKHSRFLVLLDITNRDVIPRKELIANYATVRGGTGNYKRSVVNVIYAHDDDTNNSLSYWFQWWP